MARVIQEHVKKPLADELLFGRLTKGGRVNVTVGEDDRIEVEVETPEAVP
jgi:ATP-dependent Clp protease ATP-binding subunit ClpA